MAASFKRTVVKNFPTKDGQSTPDALYWKHLKFPTTRKEFGAVSHIEFSPVEPYTFAVTSSTKVQIFSPHSHQPIKKFTRFKDTAYCGSFRGDGNLLVAGSDESHVRLFDVNSKSLLRVFKGHKGPVRVSKFSSDGLHVMTGSDDHSLKLWDIASEAELASFSDHQDYIRCGTVSQASKDIVLTGSYDHCAHLYDLRQSSRVLQVNHGAPIEAVLMYPGGGIFLTAGGTEIKVWDALAGGKLVTSLSNHHKTITSLGLCNHHQRLVSGSLDRHVKIYDVGTYQVVHTLDYPSAILSVAIAPDDSLVTVGMVDGLLSIQKREEPNKDDQKVSSAKAQQKAAFQYKLHSKTYKPSQDDHVVGHNRRQHMEKYDKMLRKFEYSRALDAVMETTLRSKQPQVTVSLLQELVRRDGLKQALAGREPRSVCTCLKFIQKNISNPAYTNTLLDVANVVLELYADKIGQWADLDESLIRLRDTVTQESAYLSQLMEVMGAMDTLFAASSKPTTQTQTLPSLTATSSTS